MYSLSQDHWVLHHKESRTGRADLQGNISINNKYVGLPKELEEFDPPLRDLELHRVVCPLDQGNLLFRQEFLMLIIIHFAYGNP